MNLEPPSGQLLGINSGADTWMDVEVEQPGFSAGRRGSADFNFDDLSGTNFRHSPTHTGNQSFLTLPSSSVVPASSSVWTDMQPRALADHNNNFSSPGSSPTPDSANSHGLAMFINNYAGKPSSFLPQQQQHSSFSNNNSNNNSSVGDSSTLQQQSRPTTPVSFGTSIITDNQTQQQQQQQAQHFTFRSATSPLSPNSQQSGYSSRDSRSPLSAPSPINISSHHSSFSYNTTGSNSVGSSSLPNSVPQSPTSLNIGLLSLSPMDSGPASPDNLSHSSSQNNLFNFFPNNHNTSNNNNSNNNNNNMTDDFNTSNSNSLSDSGQQSPFLKGDGLLLGSPSLTLSKSVPSELHLLPLSSDEWDNNNNNNNNNNFQSAGNLSGHAPHAHHRHNHSFGFSAAHHSHSHHQYYAQSVSLPGSSLPSPEPSPRHHNNSSNGSNGNLFSQHLQQQQQQQQQRGFSNLQLSIQAGRIKGNLTLPSSSSSHATGTAGKQKKQTMIRRTRSESGQQQIKKSPSHTPVASSSPLPPVSLNSVSEEGSSSSYDSNMSHISSVSAPTTPR